MDKTVTLCSERGCDRRATKRGYCDMHYRRAVKSGVISTTPRMNGGDYPSKHALYHCWASMKNRCYNKNDTRNYEWYGKRGIRVCDRWLGKNGFWNFVEDMGPRPLGFSIDRIDTDGDYCPENCRWASPKEQALNRRNSIRIYYDGEELTIEEVARRSNKCYETIRRKAKNGEILK